MKEKALTQAIIGAAMAVLNELKPGLDEKLYENALVIELGERGHTVEQQRQFPVHHHGQQGIRGIRVIRGDRNVVRYVGFNHGWHGWARMRGEV